MVDSTVRAASRRSRHGWHHAVARRPGRSENNDARGFLMILKSVGRPKIVGAAGSLISVTRRNRPDHANRARPASADLHLAEQNDRGGRGQRTTAAAGAARHPPGPAPSALW